jgi:hypothetical protein
MLARRAHDWIGEVAGGDRRVLDALAHLRRAAPPDRLAGWDPALFRYLDRALAHVSDEQRGGV